MNPCHHCSAPLPDDRAATCDQCRLETLVEILRFREFLAATTNPRGAPIGDDRGLPISRIKR